MIMAQISSYRELLLCQLTAFIELHLAELGLVLTPRSTIPAALKSSVLAQNLAQPFMIRIICSGSFVSTRPSWPNTDFNIQRFSVQSGGISDRVAAIVQDVICCSFHWMNYFNFGPTLGCN